MAGRHARGRSWPTFHGAAHPHVRVAAKTEDHNRASRPRRLEGAKAPDVSRSVAFKRAERRRSAAVSAAVVAVALFAAVARAAPSPAASDALPRRLAAAGSGLILWLDASSSDHTQLDSLVWYDSSTQANHAFATDASDAPALVESDGRLAVRFNTDEGLCIGDDTDGPALGEAYTCTLVSRYYSDSDQRGGLQSQQAEWLLGGDEGHPGFAAGGQWVSPEPGEMSHVAGLAWRVETAVGRPASHPSGRTTDYWIDGELKSVNPYAAQSPGAIGLGACAGGTSGAFEVAEVLCFDRALREEERVAVEAYLGDKHGLAVGPTAGYVGGSLPASLRGDDLLFLLDADDKHSVTGAGTRWADSSGNRHDAWAAGVSTAPERVLTTNGGQAFHVMRFDADAGDEDGMDIDVELGTPFSCFIVNRYTDALGSVAQGLTLQSKRNKDAWIQVAGSTLSTSPEWHFGLANGNLSSGWTDLVGDTDRLLHDQTTTGDEWAVMSLIAPSGADPGSYYEAYINGQLTKSEETTGWRMPPPKRLAFGTHGSVPNDPATADVAELICYDGVLSSTRRAAVEEYLMEKYGLVAADPAAAVVAAKAQEAAAQGCGGLTCAKHHPPAPQLSPSQVAADLRTRENAKEGGDTATVASRTWPSMLHHWDMSSINAAGGLIDFVGDLQLAAAGPAATTGIEEAASCVVGACTKITSCDAWLESTSAFDSVLAGNAAKSVTMWVRVDDFNFPGQTAALSAFSFGSPATGDACDGTTFGVGHFDGGWGAHGCGSANVAGSRSSAAGEWVHLAATHDGETVRIYVGASETASAAHVLQTGNDPDGVAGLRTFALGRSTEHTLAGGDRLCRAAVDEVRVYSSGLSAADVLADLQLSRPTVTHPALLHHWDFDTRTPDGDFVDSIAGNHARPQGATEFVSRDETNCAGGACVSVSSCDSYLTSLSEFDEVLLGSTPKTLTAWARTDDVNGDNDDEWLPFFAFGALTDPNVWSSCCLSTIGLYSLEVDGYGLSSLTCCSDTFSTKRVQLGKWYHLAVTFANGVVKLYIDGLLAAEESLAVDVQRGAGNGEFFFARDSHLIDVDVADGSHSLCHGALDEVRVYSAALSEGDVLEDMYLTQPRDEHPALVHWWDMEQRTGEANTGDFVDSVGLSHARPVGNGASSVTSAQDNCVVGGCVEISACDAYMESIRRWDDELSGNAARTAMAWVRVDQFVHDQTYQTFFGWGGDGSVCSLNHFDLAYHQDTRNGATPLGFSAHSCGESDRSGVVHTTPGTWSHFALTYDGTTRRMYVDGILQSTTTVALNTRRESNSDEGFHFGWDQWPGEALCYGALDEVKVYREALTAEDVLREVSRARAVPHRFPPAPRALSTHASTQPNNAQAVLRHHWSFDEASADGSFVDHVGGNAAVPSGPTASNVVTASGTTCASQGCVRFDGCGGWLESLDPFSSAISGLGALSLSFWTTIGSYDGDGDGELPLVQWGGAVGSCDGNAFGATFSGNTGGSGVGLQQCGQSGPVWVGTDESAMAELDTLTHVAVTHSGGYPNRRRIYVNGRVAATSSGAVPLDVQSSTEAASKILFGTDSPSHDDYLSGGSVLHQLCHGTLDEVRIFSGELTEEDVIDEIRRVRPDVLRRNELQAQAPQTAPRPPLHRWNMETTVSVGRRCNTAEGGCVADVGAAGSNHLAPSTRVDIVGVDDDVECPEGDGCLHLSSCDSFLESIDGFDRDALGSTASRSVAAWVRFAVADDLPGSHVASPVVGWGGPWDPFGDGTALDGCRSAFQLSAQDDTLRVDTGDAHCTAPDQRPIDTHRTPGSADYTGPAVTAGVWTHVAATFDGRTLRMYKNGALESEQVADLRTRANGRNAGHFFVGRHSAFTTDADRSLCSAYVDDVRVWDYAIGSAQVADLAGVSGVKLLHAWDMETRTAEGDFVDTVAGNHARSSGAGVVDLQYDCPVGACLKFRSCDSWLESLRGFDATLTSGAKSITLWARTPGPDGDGDDTIPFFGFGGTMNPHTTPDCEGSTFQVTQIPTSSTGVSLYTGCDWSVWGSDQFLVADAWTHIAATWDTDGTARIYLDGTLRAEATGVNADTIFDLDGHNSFFFGKDSHWDYLYPVDQYGEQSHHLCGGELDEVRVYSGALSAKQVHADFSGRPVGHRRGPQSVAEPFAVEPTAGVVDSGLPRPIYHYDMESRSEATGAFIDVASGNHALLAGGKAETGVVAVAEESGECVVGGCVHITECDAFLESRHAIDLAALGGAKSKSVVMWFRVGASTEGTSVPIVTFGGTAVDDSENPCDGSHFGLWLSSNTPGTVVFRGCGDDYDDTSTVPVPRDEWMHLVVVSDLNRRTILLNGEAVLDVVVFADATKHALDTRFADGDYRGHVRIGGETWEGSTDWHLCDGYVDDTRIYARALSHEQVVALYHADVATNRGGRDVHRGLVAHWDMATKISSGEAGTACVGGGCLRDLAGHNHLRRKTTASDLDIPVVDDSPSRECAVGEGCIAGDLHTCDEFFESVLPFDASLAGDGPKSVSAWVRVGNLSGTPTEAHPIVQFGGVWDRGVYPDDYIIHRTVDGVPFAWAEASMWATAHYVRECCAEDTATGSPSCQQPAGGPPVTDFLQMGPAFECSFRHDPEGRFIRDAADSSSQIWWENTANTGYPMKHEVLGNVCGCGIATRDVCSAKGDVEVVEDVTAEYLNGLPVGADFKCPDLQSRPRGGNCDGASFGLWVSDTDGVVLDVCGGTKVASGVQPTAGEWMHVAVAYSGGANGMVRLYVNGELVAFDPTIGSLSTFAWPDQSFIRLGRGTYRLDEAAYGVEHAMCDATFQDVRIFNATLTYLDVRDLFEGGGQLAQSLGSSAAPVAEAAAASTFVDEEVALQFTDDGAACAPLGNVLRSAGVAASSSPVGGSDPSAVVDFDPNYSSYWVSGVVGTGERATLSLTPASSFGGMTICCYKLSGPNSLAMREASFTTWYAPMAWELQGRLLGVSEGAPGAWITLDTRSGVTWSQMRPGEGQVFCLPERSPLVAEVKLSLLPVSTDFILQYYRSNIDSPIDRGVALADVELFGDTGYGLPTAALDSLDREAGRRWERVLEFDASTTAGCPSPEWRRDSPSSLQIGEGCRAGASYASGGCASLFVDPYPAADSRPGGGARPGNYSAVRFRLDAQVINSMDAFQRGYHTAFWGQFEPSLEGWYVDGISVTKGRPGARQHLYSLGVSAAHACSEMMLSVPEFAKDAFACVSHPSTMDGVWSGSCGHESTGYVDQQGCDSGDPHGWWTAVLPEPSEEPIEFRLCQDEGEGNENTVIRKIEVEVLWADAPNEDDAGDDKLEASDPKFAPLADAVSSAFTLGQWEVTVASSDAAVLHAVAADVSTGGCAASATELSRAATWMSLCEGSWSGTIAAGGDQVCRSGWRPCTVADMAAHEGVDLQRLGLDTAPGCFAFDIDLESAQSCSAESSGTMAAVGGGCPQQFVGVSTDGAMPGAPDSSYYAAATPFGEGGCAYHGGGALHSTYGAACCLANDALSPAELRAAASVTAEFDDGEASVQFSGETLRVHLAVEDRHGVVQAAPALAVDLPDTTPPQLLSASATAVGVTSAIVDGQLSEPGRISVFASASDGLDTSGCRDGDPVVATGLDVHLCEGTAPEGTALEDVGADVCADGWHTCGGDVGIASDLSELMHAAAPALEVEGCYAVNAAVDNGACRACSADAASVNSDDIAGLGANCDEPWTPAAPRLSPTLDDDGWHALLMGHSWSGTGTTDSPDSTSLTTDITIVEVRVEYVSGIITCNTNEGTERVDGESPWQACVSGDIAFELLIDGELLLEMPNWWSGPNTCRLNRVNWDITCTLPRPITLTASSVLSIKWLETRAQQSLSDNGGTVVGNLYGREARLPPPSEVARAQDPKAESAWPKWVPLLDEAHYSGDGSTASAAAHPLTFPVEITAIRAEYVSGYISCGVGSTYAEGKNVWQTCVSDDENVDDLSAAAFDLLVNYVVVLGASSTSGMAPGCKLEKWNGDLVCDLAEPLYLDVDDVLSLTHYEVRADASPGDNHGTIYVNLYGLATGWVRAIENMKWSGTGNEPGADVPMLLPGIFEGRLIRGLRAEYVDGYVACFDVNPDDNPGRVWDRCIDNGGFDVLRNGGFLVELDQGSIPPQCTLLANSDIECDLGDDAFVAALGDTLQLGYYEVTRSLFADDNAGVITAHVYVKAEPLARPDGAKWVKLLDDARFGGTYHISQLPLVADVEVLSIRAEHRSGCVACATHSSGCSGAWFGCVEQQAAATIEIMVNDAFVVGPMPDYRYSAPGCVRPAPTPLSPIICPEGELSPFTVKEGDYLTATWNEASAQVWHSDNDGEVKLDVYALVRPTRGRWVKLGAEVTWPGHLPAGDSFGPLVTDVLISAVRFRLRAGWVSCGPGQNTEIDYIWEECSGKGVELYRNGRKMLPTAATAELPPGCTVGSTVVPNGDYGWQGPVISCEEYDGNELPFPVAPGDFMAAGIFDNDYSDNAQALVAADIWGYAQPLGGTWVQLLDDVVVGGTFGSTPVEPFVTGVDVYQVRAELQSGSYACTGSGDDPDHVWEECHGVGFELLRNDDHVVEQPSANVIAPGCVVGTEGDTHMRCDTRFSLIAGDTLSVTWFEPSHNYQIDDNIGTATVDVWAYVVPHPEGSNLVKLLDDISWYGTRPALNTYPLVTGVRVTRLHVVYESGSISCWAASFPLSEGDDKVWEECNGVAFELMLNGQRVVKQPAPAVIASGCSLARTDDDIIRCDVDFELHNGDYLAPTWWEVSRKGTYTDDNDGEIVADIWGYVEPVGSPAAGDTPAAWANTAIDEFGAPAPDPLDLDSTGGTGRLEWVPLLPGTHWAGQFAEAQTPAVSDVDVFAINVEYSSGYVSCYDEGPTDTTGLTNGEFRAWGACPNECMFELKLNDALILECNGGSLPPQCTLPDPETMRSDSSGTNVVVGDIRCDFNAVIFAGDTLTPLMYDYRVSDAADNIGRLTADIMALVRPHTVLSPLPPPASPLGVGWVMLGSNVQYHGASNGAPFHPLVTGVSISAVKAVHKSGYLSFDGSVPASDRWQANSARSEFELMFKNNQDDTVWNYLVEGTTSALTPDNCEQAAPSTTGDIVCYLETAVFLEPGIQLMPTSYEASHSTSTSDNTGTLTVDVYGWVGPDPRLQWTRLVEDAWWKSNGAASTPFNTEVSGKRVRAVKATYKSGELSTSSGCSDGDAWYRCQPSAPVGNGIPYRPFGLLHYPAGGGVPEVALMQRSFQWLPRECIDPISGIDHLGQGTRDDITCKTDFVLERGDGLLPTWLWDAANDESTVVADLWGIVEPIRDELQCGVPLKVSAADSGDCGFRPKSMSGVACCRDPPSLVEIASSGGGSTDADGRGAVVVDLETEEFTPSPNQHHTLYVGATDQAGNSGPLARTSLHVRTTGAVDGETCAAVRHASGGTAADGVYTVLVSGRAQVVTCDMTSAVEAGGGWTLVGEAVAGDFSSTPPSTSSPSLIHGLWQQSEALAVDERGPRSRTWHFSDTDISDVASTGEMRVTCHDAAGAQIAERFFWGVQTYSSKEQSLVQDRGTIAPCCATYADRSQCWVTGQNAPSGAAGLVCSDVVTVLTPHTWQCAGGHQMKLWARSLPPLDMSRFWIGDVGYAAHGESCARILAANPTAESGDYILDSGTATCAMEDPTVIADAAAIVAAARPSRYTRLPATAVPAVRKGRDAEQYPATCADILEANPDAPSGQYLIRPDDSVPATLVYCDNDHDGGGWTVFYASAGGGELSEASLTSDDDSPSGNALAFEHFNTNRAFKAALARVSGESLFRTAGGNELWVNAPAVTEAIADDVSVHATRGWHERTVWMQTGTGKLAVGRMGFSVRTAESGGDFGLTLGVSAGNNGAIPAYRAAGCSSGREYVLLSRNKLPSRSFAGTDAASSDGVPHAAVGFDALTDLDGWPATLSCARSGSDPRPTSMPLTVAMRPARYPKSCSHIVEQLWPSAATHGTRRIQPDPALPPVPVSCSSDGWTTWWGSGGDGNGGAPLTGQYPIAGDAGAWEDYNMDRATKVALSKVSTETRFIANDLTFITINVPAFNESLLEGRPHVQQTWAISSDLVAAEVWVGSEPTPRATDFQAADFGISFKEFDSTPHHPFLNNHCADMLLFSYFHEGSGAYRTFEGLGEFDAGTTGSCEQVSTGKVLQAQMRHRSLAAASGKAIEGFGGPMVDFYYMDRVGVWPESWRPHHEVPFLPRTLSFISTSNGDWNDLGHDMEFGGDLFNLPRTIDNGAEAANYLDTDTYIAMAFGGPGTDMGGHEQPAPPRIPSQTARYFAVVGQGGPIPEQHYFDRVGGECGANSAVVGLIYERGECDRPGFYDQLELPLTFTNCADSERENLWLGLQCAMYPASTFTGRVEWRVSGGGGPIYNRAHWDRIGGACPPGYVIRGVKHLRDMCDDPKDWREGSVQYCAENTDIDEVMQLILLCAELATELVEDSSTSLTETLFLQAGSSRVLDAATMADAERFSGDGAVSRVWMEPNSTDTGIRAYPAGGSRVIVHAGASGGTTAATLFIEVLGALSRATLSVPVLVDDGLLRCSAGYRPADVCIPCGGASVYCPPGTEVAVNVPAGWYSLPEEGPQALRETVAICPPGFYCTGGVRFACPAGVYGETQGLSTAECTAPCPAGGVCPIGSIEPFFCSDGVWCRDAAPRGPCYVAELCEGGSEFSTTAVTLGVEGNLATLLDDGYGVRLVDFYSPGVLALANETSYEQLLVVVGPEAQPVDEAEHGHLLSELRRSVQRGATLVVVGGAEAVGVANQVMFFDIEVTEAALPSEEVDDPTASRQVAADDADFPSFAASAISLTVPRANASFIAAATIESLPSRAQSLWSDDNSDALWVWTTAVGCGRVLGIGLDLTLDGIAADDDQALVLDAAIRYARPESGLRLCEFAQTGLVYGADEIPRPLAADLTSLGVGVEHAHWFGGFTEAPDRSAPADVIVVAPTSASVDRMWPVWSRDVLRRVMDGATLIVCAATGGTATSGTAAVLRTALGMRTLPASELSAFFTIDTSVADAITDVSDADSWVAPLGSSVAEVHPIALGVTESPECLRTRLSSPVVRVEHALLGTVGVTVPWLATRDYGCGSLVFLAHDWGANAPDTVTGANKRMADGWYGILEEAVQYRGSGECVPAECTPIGNGGHMWGNFDEDPTEESWQWDGDVLRCRVPLPYRTCDGVATVPEPVA